LGLLEEVVGQLKNGCSTTSCSSKLEFDLPEELPTIEGTLETLAAALKVLGTPVGLLFRPRASCFF
jgi:hypothetical protein